MAYPTKLLGDGEEVVLDLHPHWKRLVVPMLVLLVVAAGYGFLFAQVDDGTIRLVVGVVAVLLLLWRVGAPFLRWRSTLSSSRPVASCSFQTMTANCGTAGHGEHDDHCFSFGHDEARLGGCRAGSGRWSYLRLAFLDRLLG